MVDFAKEEEAANGFIERGPKAEALKAIFDLSVAYARAKNFAKAEYWKQRLYDVDPMALTEIINAGEVIEEEKSGAIAQSHLELWPGLFRTLTNEEANIVYFALKDRMLQADEVVFEQGKRNANLYFIASGQLKIIHAKGDREYMLKTLGPGDVVGEDTFFTISVCTTSLVALSRAKVKYLERQALDGWQEQFPGLERKLLDYSLSFQKVAELVKRKGLDRRTQNRFPVEGIVLIDLLNATGKSLGREFKGRLADISTGGASFFIKSARRETVRLLLGRRIRFTLDAKVPTLSTKLSKAARITGVAYHLFKDYSVHLHFDEPLSENVISELASHLKPGSQGLKEFMD